MVLGKLRKVPTLTISGTQSSSTSVLPNVPAGEDRLQSEPELYICNHSALISDSECILNVSSSTHSSNC